MVRLRHRLDAEIARRADRWDRRTIWRGDGSKAPWARLSRTTSVAPGTARAILRRGHAITAMPATAEAWAAGELGADHVDLLADAASNGRGDLFAARRNGARQPLPRVDLGPGRESGALLDVPCRRRAQP